MNRDIWNPESIVAVVDTFFQPPIDTPAEQNTYTKAFPKEVTLSEVMVWAESKGENIKSLRLFRNN